MSKMAAINLILLVSWMLIGCCYGDDDDVISHLLLLDQLPSTFGDDFSPELIIRTNFSGEITFQEAEKFKVLLNITAPSIQDAYAVSSELVDHKGKLLLQVYEKPEAGPTYTLRWIFLLIGCLTGVVLILTVLYVLYWYSQNKHHTFFGNRKYLSNRHMYRSRNSMQLDAGAELMGDHSDDYMDGEDDRERRKMDKVRMSMKPETIIEESEDSCDDDRTNPKLKFSVPVSHVQRRYPRTNDNVRGSGMLDYPDQSGDELLENDLSPEQKVADADGSYTPLDDLDDVWHDHAVQNSQSTAKLADPRGNLDYNIQTSKSDGDLLGDNRKHSEKEKVIIPPLKLEIPKKKKSPTKGIAIPRRAEPNVYQRGLNLRPHENDLSSSPARADQIRAQVHTPEHPYVNNSFGNYIELKTPEQLSKSRISRESNDAYEMYTYPADIPMSTFKTANSSPMRDSPVYKVPKKPKPVFHSGSPTNFDFNKLDPKVQINQSNEPYSPGKFSMLSEGSSSDDLSEGMDEDTGDFLRLEDSDLDLPSPDHHGDGDELSNASLPLPSPPPMSNEFMPYDTHGRISQLSPRQSLVTPADSKEYGTMIALTGSPSPGGPYSKHSVENSRFVFPPPPTMYNPPQHGAWARRELNFPGADNGDYVGLPMNLNAPPQRQHVQGGGTLPPPQELPPNPPAFFDERRERKLSQGKRDRTRSGGDRDPRVEVDREPRSGVTDRERRQSGPDRERRGGGGGKKGKVPKYLHLTMLTTLCVLSVISGVYCAVAPSKTKVNIVVYVPPTYPYRNSTIYTAPGQNVKIQDSKGMNWFVSPDPILHNRNGTKCFMKCAHACDDNTGRCICRHGYIMDNGICRDINECQAGMIQCPHPQAGCANLDGSYECLCMTSSNLYKYGDLCLDCREPCPLGKYEIQPCKGDSKKICKECTKSCGDNFFMQKPCSTVNDAVCLKCQPKCNPSIEFEFTQCSANQNRECKAKALLPKPDMSPNVILDDLAAPNDYPKTIPYQPLSGGYPGFWLERGQNGFGSLFRIQAAVKEFQAVVLFKSVNHSDAVSPDDFQGNQRILSNYCPYPVPYMYTLKYTKHNDVFYRGDTNDEVANLRPCESDSGTLPRKTKAGAESILCSNPGVFGDVFLDITPDDFKPAENVWVEKDKSCQNEHERCENCSRSCILQMNAGLSRNCGITAADDNGRSPRVPTCVSCCTRDNCSSVCRNYHTEPCTMVRCQKGSLLQFELHPVYPTGGVFYCHVEPLLNQRLLVIEYDVVLDKHTDTKLFKGKLTLHTDRKWQKTGKIEGTDSIIHAEIDSQLGEMPNIIKGRVGAVPIDVGTYSLQAENSFLGTVTSNSNISIQPLAPFGINTKQFGKQKCSDTTLEWEDVVSGWSDRIHNSSKTLIGMYHGNSTYLISNRPKAILKIKLNDQVSLLRAVHKPTKVLQDTLTATMTLNGTHWIVVLKGQVEQCPGVFSLNLSDPYYLQVPIYHFDVGVECPNSFDINFTVPTGDDNTMSKDMQLQVKDSSGTFILMIHTVGNPDASAYYTKTDESDTSEESSSPVSDYGAPLHFSVLFIAVVVGMIVLLVFLLIFGVAWKQGIPEGDIQRFRVRHLVMFVVYISFQFIYSLFVSMTVFVVIIVAVNSKTSFFLKQYNQQRSVTTALSQLELDSMEQHLTLEIKRQNTEAVSRKEKCHSTIQSVIADVENLQKSIESATMNKIQRQSLQRLVTDHTEATFDKFSRDIQKFRDSYRKYEQYVLDKLESEMDSMLLSIQRSKWLRGAQYLYQIVAINKKLMNPDSDMVSFMSWVNMETDMNKLLKGLTLSLPDLPDLRGGHGAFDSIKQNDKATLMPKTPLSTQTINKWFIQPDLYPKRQNGTVQKGEEKVRKVTTLDPSSYTIFLVFMIIIDIFWLLHRMIKACGLGQLLLYGYPIYMDVRENKEKKKSNKKPLSNTVRKMLNRMLSTLFVPKLIGALFVLLMVYFVSLCAHKFINRETFSYLGYHNDMEDIMSINEDFVNRRLNAHAERINTLEYKMYEDAMNVNVQNHQYVLNLVETQWRAIEKSHGAAYCKYLRRIDVDAKCETIAGVDSMTEVRPDRCTFPPVLPVLYERNATSSSKIAGMQLDGFLLNIRKVINDTCYIIVVYLSSILIKELLGTVLWIYMKRSGFVSLRIIYETDEAPGSADSSTTNK